MHVGPLDDIVDTADTVALDHVEADEASVSLAGTPRVLDNPEVVVAIAAILKHTLVGLLVAGVPPLGDLAFDGGLGLGVGTGRGVDIRVRSNSSVSDNDDCVVKASGALISGDDSRVVVLEGLAASVDGDSHGLHGNSSFHVVDGSSDLAPVGNSGGDSSGLMRTKSLTGSVGTIVTVQDGTLLLKELVGVSHPGTIATVSTVVLSEEIDVSLNLFGDTSRTGITVCAIKEVLLGEARSVSGVQGLGEGTLNR